MALVTPISRKPLSFVIPTVGGLGALIGLFIGTSFGSGLVGVVGGAVALMLLALIYITVLRNEKMARWINRLGMAALGLLYGGA